MKENTLIHLQNVLLLFSVNLIPKNTNVPTTCPCFPALPGFSVFRIFCKSLRWSLHEELHHSDREEIRHPQLPDWSHRRQLRNGFVFHPWPRHIKSAEPELFTPSVTKPFFFVICHWQETSWSWPLWATLAPSSIVPGWSLLAVWSWRWDLTLWLCLTSCRGC